MPRFAVSLVCAWSLVACCLVLLTGCKPVGPNYNRPGYNAPPAYKETGASTVVVPPPNPQGGAWQPANPSDGMLKGKWWEIYQDPQLNQLEERIDTTNVQLRQAHRNLSRRARPGPRRARQSLSHALRRPVHQPRSASRRNRPLARASSTTTYNDFVIAGQASWEPDFWGRIRRTVEAGPRQRPGQRRRRGQRRLSPSTPRWPPTTSRCAASIPRSSC